MVRHRDDGLRVRCQQRDDDYDESRFGLVADEVLQYNAEINFAVAEGSNFYFFYQRSEREVYQRSRQSGATPSTNPLDDWDVTFDEENDTAGLGFKAAMGERWDFDASGTWNKSDGLADFFSPPGGTPNLAVGFDDYEDIEILRRGSPSTTRSPRASPPVSTTATRTTPWTASSSAVSRTTCRPRFS